MTDAETAEKAATVADRTASGESGKALSKTGATQKKRVPKAKNAAKGAKAKVAATKKGAKVAQATKGPKSKC